ncbi:MAG: ATP-binding protein, partial [bacterium]
LGNLWQVNKAATSKGTAGEKGTGLGLLLCKQFVEMNGGKLEASSRAGGGTTFTFTVPGGPSAEKACDE